MQEDLFFRGFRQKVADAKDAKAHWLWRLCAGAENPCLLKRTARKSKNRSEGPPLQNLGEEDLYRAQ